MRAAERPTIFVGFWATSLGTLVSRLLGTLRDVATAGLFGLAAGGVLDALVLAFRIPNLLRRLLGEGALATSYLPVVSAELARNRSQGLELAAAVVSWLAGLLTLVLLAGEACCALAWIWSDEPRFRLLVGLTAAMLPYLWFICLAAQFAATLQALSRFRLPAISAALLNVVWLAGAWWIAPLIASSSQGRAYVLAGCILLAGALQAGCQWVALRRLGLRFSFDRARVSEPGRKILLALGPLAVTLAATQINTLIDGLVAWSLTEDGIHRSIGWLPGEIAYPLRPGASAALYYAERFYQLPVGLLAVPLATAIFPVLSRHAALGRQQDLVADLSRGLRLVCFGALPATVGLILFGGSLVRVLFEYGAFTPDDTLRTARLACAYGLGVWAYCALPVIARGFYALNDTRTPLVASLAAVVINLVLDLTLVWTLGECGLALATAFAASAQVVVLLAVFAQRHGKLDGSVFCATYAKTVCATAALGMVGLLSLALIPTDQGRPAESCGLALGLLLSVAAFGATAWLLKSEELALLWPRRSARLEMHPAASRGESGGQRERLSGAPRTA